jgi:spoIIIJ-associated protein
MNYVETEGSSIDEAIDRALQELGVTRDKVDIEIISNSTRGLFGLGGRRAKVRATFRRAITLDVESPPAAERPRPTAPAPARVSATDTPVRTDGKRGAGRSVPASTAMGDGAPPAAPRPVLQDARKPARPQAERNEQHPQRAASAPAQASDGPPVDAAVLAHAATILQDLVGRMGLETRVEVVRDERASALAIHGDESGVLIGRRGQTLDALEYIVNRIVAREDEHGARIVVDSQNYRARRRQSLEDLAHRLAERARRRGKTVTLNPMSPRDRRIVHLALQNEHSLVTRSAGKGYVRKLLIIPEGERGDRRPRRPPPRES